MQQGTKKGGGKPKAGGTGNRPQHQPRSETSSSQTKDESSSAPAGLERLELSESRHAAEAKPSSASTSSQNTKKAASAKMQNKPQTLVDRLLSGADVDDNDENRCVVCCEKSDVCGLGSCGHRTCCGLCTVRLRQLHKDEKCVLCKAKLDRVFIVPLTDKRMFADLDRLVWSNIGSGGVTMDSQCNSIWFTQESEDFKKEMDSLREARCGECPSKFPSIRLMEKHLQEAHGKQLCKLCLEFRGLFLMEHRRMTPTELAIHCKSGDGTKSFEGHPSCKFCKGMMFYNSDQLYKHLNEKHESCHLCAKTGNKYQYFKDYKNLELHFEQDHFMCNDPRCRENRFVAFATEIQLQAHIATEHPDKLDQRTSALNLDFVVRGSRRHNQGEEEETEGVFRPSRSPSPAPDAAALTRMASADFPRLNRRGAASGGDERDFPPLGAATATTSSSSRRYAQTTASNVPISSSDGARPLFGGLRHLAGPSAEQEVRTWCARLVSGLTTPRDFYEYMYNLLGEVALNVIFPDIQSLVGSDLAAKLADVRKAKTGVVSSSSGSTSKRWDAPQQQYHQQLPMAAPSSAPVRLDDPSAFPSLSRPSSSSSGNGRLSRAEVREIAFGSKKSQGATAASRVVSAPVGARPATGWKKREEEEMDKKLDLSAGGGGKGGGGKQKQKKSDREKVLEFAVKFGQ